MTYQQNALPTRSSESGGLVVERTATHEQEDSSPSASWLANGRRRHARYRVELDVSLGSEHNFYAGFVENMSQGGVFIATHMLKSIGEVIDLTVHLPNSGACVRGVGEVRWLREYSEQSNVPPGMGVHFLKLENGSMEAIEAFLAEREPMFFDE